MDMHAHHHGHDPYGRDAKNDAEPAGGRPPSSMATPLPDTIMAR